MLFRSDVAISSYYKNIRRNQVADDSDSDSESVAPVTKPVTPVTKPVAPVTKPVAPVTKPVTPVTKPVPKKMSKEEIQAALQAKKDAKIAEQLALKAKKEAAKLLSKKARETKPVVEITPTPVVTASKSKSGYLGRDAEDFKGGNSKRVTIF